MSTMSLPPQTRMRGSTGRGGGRYGGGGGASYHNAALGSIPGGYRPPGNAAAARPLMPANNSNRPPLMAAPPMIYYPPPPILHQIPGNTYPRGALQTGAGAGAQSHIPAGSMMTAPSVAQVQQNSGLSSQQIYQMQQLASAAGPHYPLPPHPSMFPTGPSAQYIKPPHQQHVYTPQPAHQAQQQHTQSQPKRRTAAIKIINPDTNSEIDMSSAQSTSSGVSSASSSTTRLSDNPDTQGQSSDTENPVAKEFREKVHGSVKPAPNAIIKSPTETKAPASAIDQPLDSHPLEPVANTAEQVAAKAPAPLQNEIETSQSAALSKPTVDTDKLTETVPSVAEHEPTPGEVHVSEPDRSAEQPSAALPPEVTQSTKGDSTVGAASTDSVDFDRQPQSVSPVTSQVAVDSKTAAAQAPGPSPDSSLTVENVDPEPASLQTQSPDSLTQMNSPESHVSSAQDHSPEPTIQELPQESSGLLPTPSPSSDIEKLAAAVQEPLPIPERVDKDNETAGSVVQEPSSDTTDKVTNVDKDMKQKEREEEPPKAQSDRSRGSERKVTGTRKQEPQFKPDTVHQIEVDSEPEVEELEGPVVNGDSEDSRKYYTYDRDQLLSFRKCNQVPEDLLKAECFKSQKDSLQQPFGSIPRPKRINQGPHRKIIAHQPNREEKVELRKAENKWVRHSTTEKDTPDEDKETTEIFRKFQGILNKLTPQKFKDLAEQALKLPLLTVERLKGCIDKIFTKALQEPSFSVAYANLCRVMSPIKVSWVTEDGKDQSTSFRRELLTKCQKEFEKDKKDDEEREEMQKAVEDAETPELKHERQTSLEAWEAVARRRSLGNIRFIGELFKLKMLSESIMHDCIVRLLRSSSDEESIECFCKLIVTTGKDLDHPKGKQLMDKYFTRINEIISKKKISARIKFMLQDVQETRRNEWIARRQESLKTIDQIHREAKQEQQEEQEMIKLMNIHTHPSLAKPGRGDSGDKRRGGKSSGNSGQDEWRGKDGSSRRQEPQKVDVNRLPSFLRKGGGSKDSREVTPLAPGSSLRPNWGRTKPVTATPPPEQSKSDKQGSSKGPLRSSSGGSKRSSGVMGRGSQQGPKRTGSGGVPRSGSPVGGASFNSRSEKESALSLVKQHSHPHQDQEQAHQEPEQQKPVRDKYDEEAISRQSRTVVDELANNRDLKEALACVEEMESPNLMNVLVRECIFHALEKPATIRTATGELFHHLLTNKILSQDQVSEGLFEVLEISDDLAVDIPLFWNYFAVCVCEMVMKQSYSLNILAKTVTKACDKAPKCVTKVLACCAEQSSPDDTCKLWSQSGVTWATLGLNDSSAIEDLLESEGIMFLRSSPPAKQSFSIDDHPHLPDLVKILRTNKSDDSTMNWIKERFSEEECKTPQFVNTLTQAIITVSICGETELSIDEFRQLSLLLKKHVDENESLQIEILNAAQVTVSQLGHPRGLLNLVFNHLYDVEVVKESAFLEWKDQDSDLPGRGVALQSVKAFYEWLDQADPESDEGGT